MIYGASCTSYSELTERITEQDRPHPPTLTRPIPSFHIKWLGTPFFWWIAPCAKANLTLKPQYGILRHPAPLHLCDDGIAARPAMVQFANRAVEELGLRVHFRGLRWHMIRGLTQIMGPYIADAEKRVTQYIDEVAPTYALLLHHLSPLARARGPLNTPSHRLWTPVYS